GGRHGWKETPWLWLKFGGCKRGRDGVVLIEISQSTTVAAVVGAVARLQRREQRNKSREVMLAEVEINDATQEETATTSGKSRFQSPGKNDVDLVLVLVQHDDSRSGKED
ncbi:hypothetical protein B296_00022052, partial [Ensete ventricosum]